MLFVTCFRYLAGVDVNFKSWQPHKLICLCRHMQAGVSVFANASESAECKVSCYEQMHMPADSVHDNCKGIVKLSCKAESLFSRRHMQTAV
jgi:hypothetical protein